MKCGGCGYSYGGNGKAPGSKKFRVKVAVVEADGTVHGPCRHCGENLVIATGATLTKSSPPTIGIRRDARLTLSRRRVYVPLK